MRLVSSPGSLLVSLNNSADTLKPTPFPPPCPCETVIIMICRNDIIKKKKKTNRTRREIRRSRVIEIIKKKKVHPLLCATNKTVYNPYIKYIREVNVDLFK